MKSVDFNGRGLILAAMSSFFFSLTSLVAKLVNLPPVLLSWYGFLGLTVVSLPSLLSQPKWQLTTSSVALIILRSIVGTTFLTMSLYAVEMIPIGDASALLYTAPVFTAGLAKAFLNEPLSIRQGAPALAIITVGVLLVTQPPFLFDGREPSSGYLTGASMALAAAFFEALGNVALRRLKNLHYSLIAFSHGATSLMFTSILLMIVDDQSTIDTTGPVYLPFVVAGLTAVEQLSMIWALKVENASPVAVVQASDVVFGYFYQITFFGDKIDFLSVLGAAIVGTVVVKMATEKRTIVERREMTIIS